MARKSWSATPAPPWGAGGLQPRKEKGRADRRALVGTARSASGSAEVAPVDLDRRTRAAATPVVPVAVVAHVVAAIAAAVVVGVVVVAVAAPVAVAVLVVAVAATPLGVTDHRDRGHATLAARQVDPARFL